MESLGFPTKKKRFERLDELLPADFHQRGRHVHQAIAHGLRSDAASVVMATAGGDLLTKGTMKIYETLVVPPGVLGFSITM